MKLINETFEEKLMKYGHPKIRAYHKIDNCRKRKETFEEKVNRMKGNESLNKIYSFRLSKFYSIIASETGIYYYSNVEVLNCISKYQYEFLEAIVLLHKNLKDVKKNYAINQDFYDLVIVPFALWNRKEKIRKNWSESMECIEQIEATLKLELEDLKVERINEKC